MPPGTDEALKAASRQGWEAVLLVVIVLAVCMLSGWLIRTVLADATRREERLASDVADLQTYVQETLVAALRDTTAALAKSNEVSARLVEVVERLGFTLNERPCFWSADRQAQLAAHAKGNP